MRGLPDHAKGLLITGLGVLIITPDGLLVRLIAADSWTLTFWRGLLVAVGLGLGLIAVYRGGTWAVLRGIGRAGLWTSLLFGIGTVTFILSITHTTVANTLFIVSTSPLFAALMAWRFLGERVTGGTWAAIGLALIGIGVIASGGLDSGALVGNVAALVTALTLAGSFSIIRHHRDRNMVPTMALSGLVTAVLVLPLAQPAAVGAGDVGVLAFMGLVMLPLSFALLSIGPRYIPAPEVSLMLLLESVLGPLWVWLALGEDPGARTLLGGAIVIATLAGHALVTLRRAAARATAATSMS